MDMGPAPGHPGQPSHRDEQHRSHGVGVYVFGSVGQMIQVTLDHMCPPSMDFM